MKSPTPFWQCALIFPAIINSVLLMLVLICLTADLIMGGTTSLVQDYHWLVDNSFYHLRAVLVVEMIIFLVGGLGFGWDLYRDPPQPGDL
jgi:hypothetical protein